MTSLNFAAHPDDDLLFFNPDIAEELERGDTVIVVYMTQGDDGNDEKYIRCRRKAAWHAYQDSKYFATVSQRFFSYRSSCFRQGRPMGELYELKGENFFGLLRVIESMVYEYHPDLIRIHDPEAEPAIDHDEPHFDHIDHIYSARIVRAAVENLDIPVWAYMGYPIRYQPDNLTLHQTDIKARMWRAYQSIDTGVAGEQWDIALHRCYKRQLQ